MHDLIVIAATFFGASAGFVAANELRLWWRDRRRGWKPRLVKRLRKDTPINWQWDGYRMLVLEIEPDAVPRGQVMNIELVVAEDGKYPEPKPPEPPRVILPPITVECPNCGEPITFQAVAERIPDGAVPTHTPPGATKH